MAFCVCQSHQVFVNSGLPVHENLIPPPETVSVLKRIGNLLLDHGSTIKQVEFLGTKDLPLRTRAKNMEVCTVGTYFTFNVDIGSKERRMIRDICVQDVDIIFSNFVQRPLTSFSKCTLEEEFLPPALRSSVRDLLNVSKTNKRRREAKSKDNSNYFDPYM